LTQEVVEEFLGCFLEESNGARIPAPGCSLTDSADRVSAGIPCPLQACNRQYYVQALPSFDLLDACVEVVGVLGFPVDGSTRTTLLPVFNTLVAKSTNALCKVFHAGKPRSGGSTTARRCRANTTTNYLAGEQPSSGNFQTISGVGYISAADVQEGASSHACFNKFLLGIAKTNPSAGAVALPFGTAALPFGTVLQWQATITNK
jgi:hypothetical protein